MKRQAKRYSLRSEQRPNIVHSHTTHAESLRMAPGDRSELYGSRSRLADLTGMRSLRQSTWKVAARGIRFLDDQEMRRKWKRERRVGNSAAKLIPDPLNFSWCPPCSMSRSTSRTGRGRFILRPNLYSSTHSPRRVLRGRGSRARYGDLQALEFVSDLSATSSEFVVEADR